MKRTIPLGFLMIALAGGAIAQPASLAELSDSHVVNLTDYDARGQVILFSVGPDLRAGGEVVSEDGSADCPASWSAKLISEASGPRFEDIALTAPACADRALLEEFVDRLSRTRLQSISPEGVTLQDSDGIALMQLTIAG